MANALAIMLILFAQFASSFQLSIEYAEIDIFCEMGADRHSVKWEWNIWVWALIHSFTYK